MKLTVEQIRRIKEKALSVNETLQAQKDLAAKKEADRKAREGTKEGQAVKLIEGMGLCGSGKNTLRELVALLADLDLPEFAKKENNSDDFEPFSMLVPTKCDNGHSYQLGVPVLMTGVFGGDGGNTAIDCRGYKGNHLSWNASGLVPATKEQIDLFFSAWESISALGVEIGGYVDLLKPLDAEAPTK